MKAHIVSLISAVLLHVQPSAHSAPEGERETSLSKAVSAFNKKSLADSIGATQAPLTVEEVIAAILLWKRSADKQVSDELLAQFKHMADARKLPTNASIESLTGMDPGGAHVFDVWYVRIRMERDDGSS